MENGFNNNCINECISKICYDTIYKNNPLEPGEIDKIREEEFYKCYKQRK